MLGPLTCDVAPGYDHITGAIGGAIAAGAGTDFLCYVTPAEHLRLPDIDDVRDGVIATRIAAHSGDLVKGVRGAKVWNDQMSRYRKALNWEGMYAMAMDPDKARRYKEESEAAGSNVCIDVRVAVLDQHRQRGDQVRPQAGRGRRSARGMNRDCGETSSASIQQGRL